MNCHLRSGRLLVVSVNNYEKNKRQNYLSTNLKHKFGRHSCLD